MTSLTKDQWKIILTQLRSYKSLDQLVRECGLSYQEAKLALNTLSQQELLYKSRAPKKRGTSGRRVPIFKIVVPGKASCNTQGRPVV